jgi:hypothetical protein
LRNLVNLNQIRDIKQHQRAQRSGNDHVWFDDLRPGLLVRKSMTPG